MQAASAALPELDALGQQTIAAPVLGTVRLSVAETLLGDLEQVVQFFTVTDDLALRRSPRAQAATQGAHLEIGVRLFGRDLDHPALDAHLALRVGQKKVMAANGCV